MHFKGYIKTKNEYMKIKNFLLSGNHDNMKKKTTKNKIQQ